MGFSLDPLSFEIPSAMYSGTKSQFQFPQMPAQKWQIEYIGNEEFAAAIAYEVGCADIYSHLVKTGIHRLREPQS